ncbi:unnamed protein product [Angiostrongylus costaricensis]|uniref:Secreted protein n=1 Tax=Angiostrongylus costaricensis TaxID=334426 RepID=A0A0R3PNH0_ANGCS|nr:unnamed protein product [Angiostrongylus costaricensis]
MQAVIVVLCALCVLGLSQMTFTDRWNKRDAPLYELFTSAKVLDFLKSCFYHSENRVFLMSLTSLSNIFFRFWL